MNYLRTHRQKALMVTTLVFAFALVATSAFAALTFSSTSVVSDAALTLTGAAASTWSLSAGDLTVTADAGAINLTATGATAGDMTLTVGDDFVLNGVAASTYTIGAATTTGTITIGGTAQTGAIAIGDTASSTVSELSLGGGNGIKTINIGDGTAANVIGIGGAASTTTFGGAVVVVPTRVSSDYAYGFDINPDEAFFTGGAAQKSYLLSVRGDRPSGSAATGDSNDALIKASGNNYAANDSNFIFRGLNTGINNRSGGTLGILEGASIGSQNKSGGTSPTVRGLTVTAENYGTTATEFGGIDIVLKNEAAVATTEYGLRVRNLNNSIADAVGAAILVSDTGANTGWDYVLDMNGASVTTAEIRLSNGEIISNTTDGTISFGAANIVTTGSLIMPTSAETLVDGADAGASCVAGNKGAIVIDAANKFYGCDGTDWQVLDN